MTFENKSQLESYISKRNYPKDLQDELLQSMEQVRECINGGADNSAVAIAETIEEEQEIKIKYSLNEFQPETDENIEYDGVLWNKKFSCSTTRATELYSTPAKQEPIKAPSFRVPTMV